RARSTQRKQIRILTRKRMNGMLSWFNDLKAGRKLALGFGLCLALSALAGGVAWKRLAAIDAACDAMLTWNKQGGQEIARQVKAESETARSQIFGLLCLSVLMGGLSAALIARQTSRSLAELAQAAEGMTTGALDRDIAWRSRDE